MPVDLVSVSALSRTNAQNNEQTTSRLNVGSSYFAEVLGRIDHALAAVRIGGITYSMELGKNFTSGQSIKLQCVGLDPNPTFLLDGADGGADQAEQVTLSRTGALISQYVEDGDTARGVEPKVAVHGPIARSMADASAVAAGLRDVVGQSGLFYEAHLADCASGKSSYDTLLREPQNQPGFDPASIVAKQLDVLERQAVQWQGQVWPGQQMAWTIGVDDTEDDRADGSESASEGAAPGINSVLRLELPALGSVVARLNMQGDALNIRIEAGTSQAESVLKQALKDLALSLKDRGPVLESLMVTRRESD